MCNVQISDSRLIEIEIFNKTKMKFIALLAATVHGQLITADDGAPAASGIERAQCDGVFNVSFILTVVTTH